MLVPLAKTRNDCMSNHTIEHRNEYNSPILIIQRWSSFPFPASNSVAFASILLSPAASLALTVGGGLAPGDDTSVPYLLNRRAMRCLCKFPPRPRGIPHVDDNLVLKC